MRSIPIRLLIRRRLLLDLRDLRLLTTAVVILSIIIGLRIVQQIMSLVGHASQWIVDLRL